jgi:hypothetical protein
LQEVFSTFVHLQPELMEVNGAASDVAHLRMRLGLDPK